MSAGDPATAEIGGVMRSMVRLAVAAGLALLVAACASTPTTTTEPQNRAANAKMARLYFMWPGLMRNVRPLHITVDGVQVATINSGSYFYVDRAPGPHRIGMKGTVLLEGDWSHEVDIHAEPGPNYFQIGQTTVGQAPGTELLTRAMGGTLKGRQLGRPSTAISFHLIEPAHGPAELAKLKPAGGS